MKKKLLIIFFSTCILIFAGCTFNNESEKGESEISEVFHYNNVAIHVNVDAKPILQALGEPKSCTSEASCAFNGFDKTYYYGSFYIKTYPKDENEYVSSVWFADDSVETDEGITIGSLEKNVIGTYGKKYYNDSNAFIIPFEDSKLTIILKDKKVVSIQYEAEL